MEEGYFPRGRSVLRQIHDERLVGLFFGQRALAVGALDQRNYVGTIASTNGRSTPFARLVRTANAFETVFFGSRTEADAVLARVARLHVPVRGALARDAGPWPAGTPYSASDDELMLWTVAVIADSAQCFYELFVRRLSIEERDLLWRDYVRFGALFGMDPSSVPSSYEEFRAWFEGRLASDAMHLTDGARYTGRAIALEIPLPRSRQGAKRIHDVVMLGSLPPRVRSLYELSFSRRDARAFDFTVAALRALRVVSPRALLRGGNERSFAVVAATERRRLRLGIPTPQVPAE